MLEKDTDSSAAALKRFLDSMTMDFDKWHDGIGYDIAALGEMNAVDRAKAEAAVLSLHKHTWRELEVFARFDSPRSNEMLQWAAENGTSADRIFASKLLGDDAPDKSLENAILNGLRSQDVSNWSKAIDAALNNPTAAIIDELFAAALNRDDEVAYHAAATLLVIYKVTDDPHGSEHRPFLLRFRGTDRRKHVEAFSELCGRCGVEVGKHLK